MLLFTVLPLSLLADNCDFPTDVQIEDNTEQQDSTAIVTNSFWDNWYAQIGGDMILLFPVKHKVKDVFPNGKSLGVSVAVGKWFSPIFGGKFKANWNNVIIRETHNVTEHNEIKLADKRAVVKNGYESSSIVIAASYQLFQYTISYCREAAYIKSL